jgi:A/G-specific adenine glycosylase
MPATKNPASPDCFKITSPLTPRQISRFRRIIYEHYAAHGRRLPWRETEDPYHILVSEFMLQQTQVARVLTKYASFLARFPDFGSLASSALKEVLAAWQGLGYNRRALALVKTAHIVMAEFGGLLPEAPQTLKTLPGIGEATAGAISAFAYEHPVVFIETNIRRVFLQEFFPGQEGVRDAEILPLIETTLDRPQVRDWYYALMDYGAKLKTAGHNPNRHSAHYSRQSPFAGSDRRLRGLILKLLLTGPARSLEELVIAAGQDPHRIGRIVCGLVQEGFLVRAGDRLEIASFPGRPV